jgi:hypothetical protein
METSYLVIILTGSAGIVGFLLRMFMDNINSILNNRKHKRIEHLDFLLSEFYMPIYILLHREDTIWKKIKQFQENENSNFIIELDKENLDNHLEIQKIIMSNIAKASPQSNIAEKLVKYDEHVTMYKTLRKIGCNEFPSDYGSNYPTELYKLIEKRIEELKQDKKLLLGLFGNTPIFYKKVTYYTDKLLKNFKSKKNNDESNNDESNNDESNNNVSNNNEYNNNYSNDNDFNNLTPQKSSHTDMHCSATQRFTLKKDEISESDINSNNYSDNFNDNISNNLTEDKKLHNSMICSPTQDFILKKNNSDIEMNSNNI